MRPYLHKLCLVVCSILYTAIIAHAAATLPVKRVITPSCAGLAESTLPQTRILTAELIPAGTLSISGVTVPAFAALPEFCRIIAQSRPSTDSDIGIEVWLPVSAWNGRFFGTGNGGFGGEINYSSMANALAYKYATAGTDTGHIDAAEADASWALGHPQKIMDFGYRAIHEMTLTALALIESYYGKAPAHKYFASCSDGGREGLMEAQRYPTDYNGILAGDPANNWTGMLANGAVDLLALATKSTGYVSAAKLPAITAAVLAACNKGVPTGYLNNPPACKFNPQTMLCKGAETSSCLTQPEITTLKQIYAGTETSTGTLVFPGLTPGGEAGDGSQGWAGWVTGPAPAESGMANYVETYYANMVYQDAAWTYRSFNLTTSLAQSLSTTGSDLDATNPSLPGFLANRGKLILYHGWNDPAISPLNTVNYYNSVVSVNGQKASSETVELFLVPGMAHCEGGPGPTSFGAGGPGPDTPAYDATHSIYKALETWVEDGTAPKQIITSGVTTYNGQTIPISRPLCPYPQIATYTGSGSQYQAANFTCTTP